MSVLTPVEVTDLRPIRDIVHEKLRTAILRGHIASGERLYDTHIAKQLGVSRTPVREALRMLEQESLILVTPRRGTIVSSIKQEDAVEIYNVRAVLEGLALRLAAENITPPEIAALRAKLELMKPLPENLGGYMSVHAEFNAILIKASRSPRVEQLLALFTGQLRNLRGISLSTPARQELAWREHCAIVDAVASGNGELVEQLARRHVENAKEAYLQQWT